MEARFCFWKTFWNSDTQTVDLEEWKLLCAPRMDCEEPQVTLTTHPLCRAKREEAAPPGRGARDPVSLESETRTHSLHYSAEPRCRDHEIQSDRCVERYGRKSTTLTDAHRWKRYFLEAVLFCGMTSRGKHLLMCCVLWFNSCQQETC